MSDFACCLVCCAIGVGLIVWASANPPAAVNPPEALAAWRASLSPAVRAELMGAPPTDAEYIRLRLKQFDEEALPPR